MAIEEVLRTVAVSEVAHGSQPLYVYLPKSYTAFPSWGAWTLDQYECEALPEVR